MEVAYAAAKQYLTDGQTGRVLSLTGLEKAIQTALIEVLDLLQRKNLDGVFAALAVEFR
jgi:hypothetical protein